MKKISLITCMAVFALNAFAQPSKSKLDSLMGYYSGEYGFNGVAFIAMKGNILLHKGYGYRDIDRGIKNEGNTIFQMGSNTKQFTAEIILQLAMKGKLDLQDKLTKYFPDYPNGNKITIKNLLTHTSGIYNYTEDTFWDKHDTEHISKDAMLAHFKDKPLEFKPGSEFKYSNSNYILLGYIIEAVTGKKYEDVVRENILIPCHMTHSGFDFANLKDSNKATGYNVIQAKYNEPATLEDSSISFAAGALYSTATDMYQWHKALQNYMLLPEEWQEKAYKPFKGRYGYGWFIDSHFGKRLLGHSGGVPGFYTYEMRITEDDLCILLLQNCMKPAMDNNTICVNILKCIYDSTYHIPAHRVAIDVSQEILKRYNGEYAVTPDFSITVKVKGDKLYAQGTGQDEFLISPVSETKFFSKEVGATIEFVKDTEGKYSKLILSQGGQEIPAIRK